MKNLRRFFQKIRSKIAELLLSQWRQEDMLYAFYDLSVSPAHFDFINFILLAELRRIAAGCAAIHVVIVPAGGQGFNHSAREKNGQGFENLWWRVRHILVPSCSLLPSCRQVTVCESRQEARAMCQTLARYRFPSDYVGNPDTKKHLTSYLMKEAPPEKIPSLQATPLALFYVEKWMQSVAAGRKVVTISLREATYSEPRNSDMKAWADFAKSLDPSVYFPVVVRDLEAGIGAAPGYFEGIACLNEVAWNLELRAALYEKAYLNLSVSNGPNLLMIFNKNTRYLIFKMLKEECKITPALLLKYLGLVAGKDWPMASAYQHIVWEDDRLDVIQKAFKEMCAKIEGTAPYAAVSGRTVTAGL